MEVIKSFPNDELVSSYLIASVWELDLTLNYLTWPLHHLFTILNYWQNLIRRAATMSPGESFKNTYTCIVQMMHGAALPGKQNMKIWHQISSLKR